MVLLCKPHSTHVGKLRQEMPSYPESDISSLLDPVKALVTAWNQSQGTLCLWTMGMTRGTGVSEFESCKHPPGFSLTLRVVHRQHLPFLLEGPLGTQIASFSFSVEDSRQETGEEGRKDLWPCHPTGRSASLNGVEKSPTHREANPSWTPRSVINSRWKPSFPHHVN